MPRLRLFGLALLPVCFAHQLAAQSRLTAGVGAALAVQSDQRFETGGLGPAFGGFVAKRLSTRFTLRGELFAAFFGRMQQVAYTLSPCPPPSVGGCGPNSPSGSMAIAALTTSLLIDDAANPQVRTFASIGAGLYGAFSHPAGDHRAFPGLHAGFGERLGQSRMTSLEARYNWIPGWKGGGLSLVSLGFGVTL
jgi:hypothetical protein